MRESDAFSWYMERDPVLRSTVVSIAWLERSPDWDVLAEKVDRGSRLVPMQRQRVIEPPGRLATPRWTRDIPFDLGWHLRRVDAPAPHDARTVIEFARKAASTGFDPARPLWEFTLIENLTGGRAAFVMKLHHAIADGIGGMQLALLLFDLEPAGGGGAAAPSEAGADAIERVGRAELVRQSVGRNVDQWRRVLASGAGHAVPAARQVLIHPAATAKEVWRTAGSIGRMVAPVLKTLSPTMTDRSLDRQLDVLEVSADDLKAAAHAAGGTLNDAFLAGVTGGLRRYHERHGAAVDQLRVTLPISIRKPTDPAGGNRITLMRFAVPVANMDAAARILEMHRACQAARDEPAVPYTNAVAGALNLLPRSVVGSMLKHVDFLASDVPGFTFPVYLAGAQLERWVPFGPTIGASINLTLLSYNGTCSIGVNVDTAAIPDTDVVMECLAEGFEEVLALAGEHRPVVRPIGATEPALV